MNKKAFLLLIFLFVVSFVNAFSYEDSDALYDIVFGVDDGDEFIVILSLLDDDELDLRNEVALSNLLRKKANEFEVDLNDYNDLKLYGSIFSKASWYFSNYITGFASGDRKDGKYGKDRKDGKMTGDTSKDEVVVDTTIPVDWSGDGQQAQTSDGYFVFNPSGTYVTQSDVYTALYDSGVEDFLSYDIDDVMDNEILFEILTDFLGYSPLLVLPNQAIASYDGKITTYSGKIYDEDEIKKILAEKGIGMYTLIGAIESEEVKDILKEKIGVSKIINPSEQEKKGEIGEVCRNRKTVWKAIILKGKVVKYLDPIKECIYTCKEGKCVGKDYFEKEIVEEIIEGPESKKEEFAEEKQVEIVKNKKKKQKEEEIKEIRFIEPKQFSVEKISSVVKPLFASSECKPRCKNNCGLPNGCGGICPKSDLNIEGKCGNQIRIVNPKTTEEVFIKTTANIADKTQDFFKWILVS